MQTDPSFSPQSENSIKLNRAREQYPILWHNIIQDWKSNADEDAAWLTYSANYLLRTDRFLWALDPYTLFTRIGGSTQPAIVSDLSTLQVVVLSHEHSDHLDLNIITALHDLPITWVIPKYMIDKVISKTNLKKNQITIPEPGVPLDLGKLILTPFKSQHFLGRHGVPEMGYLAEFSGKRWLFPGDVRLFEQGELPLFKYLNGVVAHLWLGKDCAMDDSFPLIPEFCRFYKSFNPRQIIITHMEELGRDERNYWDIRHFQKISIALREQLPFIKVFPAFTGQKFLL